MISTCWVNVYKFPSGKIWLGTWSYSREAAGRIADNAVRNGSKLLYRIKVKLK
jgi:hypothetical protein